MENEEYKDKFSAEYEKLRDERENEDFQEYATDGCLKILFFALLIIGISGVLVFNTIKNNGKYKRKTPTRSVSQSTNDSVTIRTAEWLDVLNTLSNYKSEIGKEQENIQTLQQEVKKLKTEVESHKQQLRNLRNELNDLKKKETKDVKTDVKPEQRPSTPPQSRAEPLRPSKPQSTSMDGSKGFRSDALVVVKYEHDCLRPTANLYVHNSTGRTVKSFQFRITYYDMKGNMLDYKDISQEVQIEPEMVRMVEIEGFGWKDQYVYYSSKNADYGRQYRIKAELKSYVLQ